MQLFLLGILLIVGYVSADGVCSLPAETGPCRAAFRRFHYNEAAGKCEMFIYGGCQGNGNNFESKDECESQCSRVEKQDSVVCHLPAETGPCRAAFRRFHFNEASGKCEMFIYGGCQGNGNNFESKDECESQCSRVEKRDVGVCSLPAETGPCRAAFPRFHYNEAAGKCEMFIYGGCQGNGNNFESKDECESQCSRVEKRDVGVCKQQPETGNCRMYLERYFFNSNTGTCEQFVYGGCGGNENNFETIEECGNHCLMKKREVDFRKRSLNEFCMQPKKIGHCRARLPRVYYNSQTGRCERFNYGGCGGNKNNFKSMDECEASCHA